MERFCGGVDDTKVAELSGVGHSQVGEGICIELQIEGLPALPGVEFEPATVKSAFNRHVVVAADGQVHIAARPGLPFPAATEPDVPALV